MKNWIFCLVVGLSLFACDNSNQQTEKVPEPATPETIPVEGPEAQLRSLTKQIEANPDNYALLEERSRVYYSMDSLYKAQTDLQAAIKLFPEGPQLYYLQGFYAFSQNDTAMALSYYQEAARLGSEEPENYYQMGQIFFFQGNDALALKMYEQARELNPYEPIYAFAQGFLHEQKQENQLALRYYLQSLAIDSSFAKSRLQLHDLYLNQYSNAPAAMAQIDTLLLFQPTHPLGRFYEGNAHMNKALGVADQTQNPTYQKALEDAVFSYSLSINKHPNFLQARYNRGFCYFLAQNFERAIEDFQAVLGINAEHLPSLLMMGSIQQNFQDLNSAATYYEKATQVAPDNQEAKAKLAEVRAMLN